jgi:hypothetical protein
MHKAPEPHRPSRTLLRRHAFSRAAALPVPWATCAETCYKQQWSRCCVGLVYWAPLMPQQHSDQQDAPEASSKPCCYMKPSSLLPRSPRSIFIDWALAAPKATRPGAAAGRTAQIHPAQECVYYRACTQRMSPTSRIHDLWSHY